MRSNIDLILSRSRLKQKAPSELTADYADFARSEGESELTADYTDVADD